MTEKEIINYLKNLKIGDKIKFKSEKQKYTVKAISDNFIICTKPFNLKKTVLYTIIDINRFVRGADNFIFGHGYETDDDINDAIELLKNGEMEVSYRNYIKLDVEIKSFLRKQVEE